MERQLKLSLIHQNIVAEKAELLKRSEAADEDSAFWMRDAITELDCALRSLQYAAKCVGHVEGRA